MTSSRRNEPFCGEVWTVAFDPTVGSEIRKTRPAIRALQGIATCIDWEYRS